MNDLLDFVIERQGGIDRWYEASTVSATVHVHDGFWAFKGQPDRLGVEPVTADIHRQRITVTPFGHGSSLEFDTGLDRVRIIGSRGEVEDELKIEPRTVPQTYHFDSDTGLQRRMDYSPDVNGEPLVAHYTSEHHDFGGLIVQTRGRVLLLNDEGLADQSFCAILFDVSWVQLNK